MENFLYDYISDLIDNNNYSYASELVEGFSYYVKELKWFLLLRARIVLVSDPQAADELVLHMIPMTEKDDDLEFNLELLAFLVFTGRRDVFHKLAKRSIPILKTEEDFQDLLSICADYFHDLDREKQEREIRRILHKRSPDLTGDFDVNDPDLSRFLPLLDELSTGFS